MLRGAFWSLLRLFRLAVCTHAELLAGATSKHYSPLYFLSMCATTTCRFMGYMTSNCHIHAVQNIYTWDVK